MTAITKAFNDAMVADATLVAMLGTFQGNPSILTKRPLPPGFTVGGNGPYILAAGDSISGPGISDVKNATGREIVRDVLAFCDLSKSPDVVEAIGDRIRTIFHRVKVAVDGYSIIIAEASGPIEVDEEDALGRAVSVRWVLEEN